jgi:hypothetical protein
MFSIWIYTKFRRIDLDETARIDLQAAIAHGRLLKHMKMPKWNALDMHI